MHLLDAGLFPCPSTRQLWCLLTGTARRARQFYQNPENVQTVKTAGEECPVQGVRDEPRGFERPLCILLKISFSFF